MLAHAVTSSPAAARPNRFEKLHGALIGKIETYDKNGPALNAIVLTNPRATEEADALDARFKESGPVGPLHCVPMLVRFNKFGSFLGCSGYPECKQTRSLDQDRPEHRELGTDPASGRPVLLKEGPYGPYVERPAASEDAKPERTSLPAGPFPAFSCSSAPPSRASSRGARFRSACSRTSSWGTRRSTVGSCGGTR